MRLYPDDPRLFRHRGHRYITVREFDRAIADLERAASLIAGKPDEVEPDGQPNARNIPTSTLHTNIWYHLALARYLKADYTRSIEDWKRCRAAGKNADNLVSARHWLYTTLRRAGRTDRHVDIVDVLAAVTPTMDVIENMSYHSLLLLYKGVRTEAEVLAARRTLAPPCGTASALAAGNGRQADATKLWERILEGADWPSFGHIAAEADVARNKSRSAEGRSGNENAKPSSFSRFGTQ